MVTRRRRKKGQIERVFRKKKEAIFHQVLVNPSFPPFLPPSPPLPSPLVLFLLSCFHIYCNAYERTLWYEARNSTQHPIDSSELQGLSRVISCSTTFHQTRDPSQSQPSIPTPPPPPLQMLASRKTIPYQGVRDENTIKISREPAQRQ